MSGERADDNAARGPNVPQEDGFIVGARDEHIALGAEGQAVDIVVVAEQRDAMGFPRCHVP